MNGFDEYSLKARIYPSFLVLLPILITGLYYITDFQKYYHYFTAMFIVGVFTYVLAQVGRDKGKIKEPILNNHFGGKPTTQVLRHRNSHIDNYTKNRYHQILSQKISNIIIPSPQQELNNPNEADEIYDSCTKFLISKTRDTTKFNLLFKENISYGFRRNLWGMKDLSLSIILILIILHFIFVTNFFTIFNNISLPQVCFGIFLFTCAIIWIFIITKDWVKLVAFSYAERLYETLNDL